MIQDCQDQGDELLEYGEVYELVNGHLDQIIEESDHQAGFIGDIIGHAFQVIDIHDIAKNIHEELADNR